MLLIGGFYVVRYMGKRHARNIAEAEKLEGDVVAKGDSEVS